MLEATTMAGPITVPSPKPIKPKPIKPKPITPKPITPIKAHGSTTTHCIRCKTGITAETGVVRKVCSPCDLELQTMHWEVEYALYRKVTYMPEPAGEDFSAKWYEDNGYSAVMRKPPRPYRRSFFRHPTTPTLLS